MRYLLSLLIAIVCISLTGVSAAHADEKDDIVYGSVGMGGAQFTGGDFESGLGIGHRAGLGVRVSPELAIEATFTAASDPLTSGVSSTGLGVGVNWRAFRHLEVIGSLRYRQLEQKNSVAEAFGHIVGEVVGVALCGDDPDCRTQMPLNQSTVHDLGLEIAVASQWQWSWFTLGVEWASAHQSVAVLSQKHLYESEGSKIAAPTFEAGDMPLEMRFLTLNLGASF